MVLASLAHTLDSVDCGGPRKLDVRKKNVEMGSKVLNRQKRERRILTVWNSRELCNGAYKKVLKII